MHHKHDWWGVPPGVGGVGVKKVLIRLEDNKGTYLGVCLHSGVVTDLAAPIPSAERQING